MAAAKTKLTIEDLPARIFGIYWSDKDAKVTRDGEFWVVDCKRHKRAYIYQQGRWEATTLRKGAK